MLHRRTIITVSIVVCSVLLFLSFVMPVQREMGWIDAVTASTKHQTYITFNFDMTPLMTTTPEIKQSLLAEWLIRKEGKIEYDWRHVNGTLKTIWGKPVGWGHGFSPPIRRLWLLDDFVKSSSDEDLRHFVDVMHHGSKKEQEDAVKAAIEKCERRWSNADDEQL